MSIIILDESVANKIAAGEVVERPASVVKELVENAIDAEAGRITVEIEEGGRKLMRISDDGIGMSREDAVLALQRHATSKIRTAEDLQAIGTLGFRGEALPSIAAVSHLKLVTRRRDATEGVELTAEGGVISDLRAVGAPPGTEVSVAHLFYNTPARLKFLRRDSTEVAAIAEVMNAFALAHHLLSLRLTNNGREVFHRPASTEFSAAVASLLGRATLERLIPLELRLPFMAVKGYVSRPEESRASRAQQRLYVNRRHIRSRLLTHALEDAYGSLLPGGRFPMAVVLVEIDPQLVDVNVHPTKAEVRFSREAEVHSAVRRAVAEALAGAHLSREGVLSVAGPRELGAAGPGPAPQPSSFAIPSIPPAPTQQWSQAGLPIDASSGLPLVPVGQLRTTFILAEGPEGLLVVDQHRAHERITYERLLQEQDGAPIATQGLVSPATIELSHREAAVLEEHLDTLTRLGFEIEEFGPNAFAIRSVPALLARDDPAQLLRDLIEDLAALPHGPQPASAEASAGKPELPRERALRTMACHAAIKAGQTLGLDEMTRLLGELRDTANPYACPHGDPILMTISNFELARKFNR